jgi:hypothetical protein
MANDKSAQNKPSGNRRRNIAIAATTGGAAALVGGAALLLSGRDGTPAEAAREPAAAPPTAPNIPAPQGGETPVAGGYRALVSQSQEERVTNAPVVEKKDVATIIDTTLDGASDWGLALKKTEDNNVQVQLIPLVAPNPATTTATYFLNSRDPMHKVGSSERDIRDAMEQIREKWRYSFRANKNKDPDIASPKKVEIYSPPVPGGESVDLPQLLLHGKSLIRCAKLGPKESAPVQWLEKLGKMAVELVKDFSHRLDLNDEMTKFIKNTVTNPETGGVDVLAFDMMQRIFALDDAARGNLKHALQGRDYLRAVTILERMNSADTPMPREVFDGLRAYVEAAKASGLSIQDARSCLEFRMFDGVEYDKIMEKHTGDDAWDKGMNVLHRTLTPEVYAKLRDIDVAMLETLLPRVIPDKEPLESYEAIMASTPMFSEKRLAEKQKILEKLADNTLKLFGDGKKPGWLDQAKSHDNNVPSVLHTIDELRRLEFFVKREGDRISPAFSQALQVGSDRNVYLLFSIPTDDIDKANSWLGKQDAFLRAMKNGQAILGSEQGHDGRFLLPPGERAGLFFVGDGMPYVVPDARRYTELFAEPLAESPKGVMRDAAMGEALPAEFSLENVALPGEFNGIGVRNLNKKVVVRQQAPVIGR